MRRFVFVGIWTFLLSIAVIYVSRSFLTILAIFPSFLVLLFIVFTGILSDIVGVAATAGREQPLHAMAADKVPGARHAIWLVRHADRVATFAQDVVGDIAGTVSGAIAAGIIFRIVQLQPTLGEALLTTVLVAVVAAVTVTGKSYGKSVAIRRSNDIIMLVGRVLYRLERTFGLRLLSGGNNKQGRKRPDAKPHRR